MRASGKHIGGKKLFLIILFSVLMTVIAVAATDSIIKTERRRSYIEDNYNEALALFGEEKYSECFHTLCELRRYMDYSDYRDIIAFTELSSAHISYEEGNVLAAERELGQIRFKETDPDSIEGYREFAALVRKESVPLKEEAARRDLERYRERIENGVPYVGMSESEIKNTSLGSPSDKVGSNMADIKGKFYKTTIYYFYKNGALIFSARCARGSVINVWDYRDAPRTFSLNTSASKNRSSGIADSDPLNAKDYSDPEDFYFDNEDDFEDFEDAEDYFNEHNP